MINEPIYCFVNLDGEKIVFWEHGTLVEWTLPKTEYNVFMSEFRELTRLIIDPVETSRQISRLVRKYWYGY